MMKKLFKNRYFLFLMIYLCFLSVVGTSMSFSRFLTQDSSEDKARAAIYNVEIYGGTSETKQDIVMEIYATSKISETVSMQIGTYQYKQVNVINKSECDISISDCTMVDSANSVYTKLLIPYTEEEFTNYLQNDGTIPTMVLQYLEASVEDFSSYDLGEIDQLNELIEQANKVSCASMGWNLKPNESAAFFIVSWVEHDSVYKEDAGTDNISYKTLTELGVTADFFSIQIHSDQID